MTEKKILIPIFSLFLAFFLVSSLKGQVKTNTMTSNVSKPKPVTRELPKMIKKQGTYSYMTHTGPHSDTGISISDIIEDKQGNIWVATMGEGVYCYNGKTFTNLTSKDGLITNVVYSIMEDKDKNLWFGTTNGVSRYDGESFTNFPFSVIRGNSPIIESETSVPNAHTEVWSMLQAKNGNIWLGTTNGVYCYDGAVFTNILKLGTLASPLKSEVPSIRAVPAIIEDKVGNIWFTSWFEGLFCFDSKQIINFKTDGLLNNDGLLQDKYGDLWIVERGNGVHRYNGKTFEKLFSGTVITEMEQNKDGNIWLSTFDRKTNSGNVILYNPPTKDTILQFSPKHEIGSSIISTISIDRSGNVWFGTNKMTLNKYDGKIFTHFLAE